MKKITNKRHNFQKGDLIRPYRLTDGGCWYLVIDNVPCKLISTDCNCMEGRGQMILKCLNLETHPPVDYCATYSLGWRRVQKEMLPKILEEEYKKWLKRVKT